MGFRSARQSERQDTADTNRGHSARQASTAHGGQSTGSGWTTDIDRAEQQFGMTIPDTETLRRLQHHERTYGRQVQQWAAEGMPVDIMGRTRQMEAFRERQAERPPEVPTNIERRNRRSVLRSEQAAAETGPTGNAGVPESVQEVITSTGRSLDASIQRAMEDRMGDSLGDVRIHTGPQAAAACEAINARAFTVGNHVAFNQGEYDPSSPEGQHVLAHELAHVRQQTDGAVSMLPQEDVELEVDPDPALEREAEETAQRVMAGGELDIQRLADTEVHVQRSIKEALSSVSETVADWRSDSDESRFQQLDDGDLAETVGALVENQREIMTTLEDQQRGLVDKVGESTGKGIVGGMIGLGVTAATQSPLIGTLAASTTSDVGKTLYGSMYQRGTETLTDVAEVSAEKLDGIKESITDYVDRKLDERLGGSGTNTSEDPLREHKR